MATNLNTFSLAGNLVADPKITADDVGNIRSVLFTVAVNRGRDKTNFIPVRLTEPQYTEHMRQKLIKGAGVILHGRVENTVYRDMTCPADKIIIDRIKGMTECGETIHSVFSFYCPLNWEELVS